MGSTPDEAARGHIDSATIDGFRRFREDLPYRVACGRPGS